jgi:hypothetical protein
MWDNVFHMPRGGVDASVLENGLENIAPDGPLAAQTSGKHLHSCFAQLSLFEHCSLGQLSAVRATSEVPALRILPVGPVAVAVPHVIVMPGLYAEDGWVDVEVPRGPVDPMWRNTVVAFAVSRQYEGVEMAHCFAENEHRFILCKELVAHAISLCQGPRAFKTNIDMVAAVCGSGALQGQGTGCCPAVFGHPQEVASEERALLLAREGSPRHLHLCRQNCKVFWQLIGGPLCLDV